MEKYKTAMISLTQMYPQYDNLNSNSTIQPLDRRIH